MPNDYLNAMTATTRRFDTLIHRSAPTPTPSAPERNTICLLSEHSVVDGEQETVGRRKERVVTVTALSRIKESLLRAVRCT